MRSEPCLLQQAFLLAALALAVGCVGSAVAWPLCAFVVQTFFLAALAMGRVLIVAAWVYEDYHFQHAEIASAAAYTSTPFLHIILALLFSK